VVLIINTWTYIHRDRERERERERGGVSDCWYSSFLGSFEEVYLKILRNTLAPVFLNFQMNQ